MYSWVVFLFCCRFYADTLNSGYKKNQIYVNFPLENLNVKPYLAKSYEQKEMEKFDYNLYSVSNHYGHMDRGHYTAFCKSRIFNK